MRKTRAWRTLCMKTCKHLTYTREIQWRIRALWLLLTGMLVYMVLIAELGGGDSRMMTPLADKFSRIVFFGGLGYVIGRILQKQTAAAKQAASAAADERRNWTNATSICTTKAAALWRTSCSPSCSLSRSPRRCSTWRLFTRHFPCWPPPSF